MAAKRSVDLSKGISIQVEGELGKFHTLPVDVLADLGKRLQELILAIARNDIDSSEAITLDHFKIELSGFRSGSAVPEFIFTPRVQLNIGDIIEQRKQVSQRFSSLMQVAAKGLYTETRALYPDAARRSEVVNSLFEFRSSVAAPMALVEMPKTKNGKPRKIFALKPFKKETRQLLVTKVIEPTAKKTQFYAVARVKVSTDASGKKKQRIEEIFEQSKTTLAFAPDTIVFNERVYNLNWPLRCALVHDEDGYSIENEMLGIIGTGPDLDVAEQSFSEEFDFVYRRYQELKESQMTKHVRDVKQVLQFMVASIDE